MNLFPPAVRDVVNAPALRQAIVRRSMFRRDPVDLRRWFENHFFRWAVGQFEHVVPVGSLEAWAVCAGKEPVPDWFRAKLAAGRRDMVYIDPEHRLLREQELKMVEYLQIRRHRLPPERLQRITAEAAARGWEADHARMQRKQRRGWQPSDPLALEDVVATPHGRFVELRGSRAVLRAEMSYESFHMQHCLGQFADRELLEGGYGEHYAKACEEGRLRLFSLRDANNQPHVTVSLVEDFGEWAVDQIKGKQNEVPLPRYVPDLLQFLNALRPRPNDSADLMGVGLVAHPLPDTPEGPGGFAYRRFVEVEPTEAQHDLLAASPHFAAHLPTPDPRTQWLILAAGGTPCGRHAAVAAALELTAGDAPSTAAGLPAWFASRFPRAPSLLHQEDGRHWLRRFIGPSAQTLDRQWALAVAEPLFHRHNLTGMARPPVLSAPSQVPQRQQALIREELGLDRSSDAQAVEDFRQGFFLCPEFQALPVGGASQPGEAWHLLAARAMRQCYVLRLLVSWGLLDEALGWALLLLNAQRVRTCFGGWDEFGMAAARGRTWLASRGDGPANRTAEVEWGDFRCVSRAWRQADWPAFDLAPGQSTSFINPPQPT
jgi:hypothetical protein